MHVLFLLLTFNFLVSTSAQPIPPPPPPPSGGCATDLVAFSPCLMYVSLPPNNLTETVPSQCCDAVSVAFESRDGNCLCYLLRQPLIFGFPLNETRVVSLSSTCNTNGSLESICSSGSPALPPLRSTTGSEVSNPSDSEPVNAAAPPQPAKNTTPTLSLPAADGVKSPSLPSPSSRVIPASDSSPTKQISNSSGWLLLGVLLFLVLACN